MIDYRAQVTIQRSPQEVFDFVSNPENSPRWTEMEAPKAMSGGRGAGMKFEQPLRMGSRKADLTWEVTAWEPSRKYALRTIGAGPVDWRGTMEFEPAGDSATRMTAYGELRFRGLMRLMEPFMAGEVRKGEAAELQRLKQVLERGDM